jgi:hypothetical protein
MQIDILKIDIEGGEYELLVDPRFSTLSIRTVVLEWHNSDGIPDGGAWSVSQLESLGYRTTISQAGDGWGLLWAFRDFHPTVSGAVS